MAMQVQTYRDISRELLEQAFADLEQGNTRQASENGWGAAAQMLKSIAEQRGWGHQGHKLIRQAASRLADEMENDEVRRLYRVADSLHINFYEDLDTAADVAAGLEDVRQFLDLLEQLAPPIEFSRYLVNVNGRSKRTVVHRAGGCGDARKYGHKWDLGGWFANIGDASEALGIIACWNCTRKKQ